MFRQNRWLCNRNVYVFFAKACGTIILAVATDTTISATRGVSMHQYSVYFSEMSVNKTLKYCKTLLKTKNAFDFKKSGGERSN